MPSTVTPLLNVADVAASVPLYERLGFALEQRFEAEGALLWVRLRSGDGDLMLNLQTKIGASARRARPHYGDLVLYLRVASAHAMRDRLIAAGIEVTEVERQAYGVDECYVRDPDGYELAIVSGVPKA
jgi:catechol 2,3-dioxygenase-like lactoylglutathione lyase family enzyme